MAKEDKAPTVVVEKVIPAPIEISETRIFVDGKIRINGVIDRKQFNKAFKGKIEVDIDLLWTRYQKFLKK